jgi:ribosomal protein S18 acetylase RimI-like enzyme
VTLIRPARQEDALALARVLVDTGRVAHRGQVPDEVLTGQPVEEAYAESERNWARTLRELAEDPAAQERILVAETADGVVGIAMCGPPKEPLLPGAGEVYLLYVSTAHQRAGIGRRLVRAVVDHLAAHRMNALLIGCLAANVPARRFYEALGGRVVAERQFEQDGILLPEVVYGWADVGALAAK